jgi:hypothetical protein
MARPGSSGINRIGLGWNAERYSMIVVDSNTVRPRSTSTGIRFIGHSRARSAIAASPSSTQYSNSVPFS